MLAISWLYPAYILPHYTFANGTIFPGGLCNYLTIFDPIRYGYNTNFPDSLVIIIAKSPHPDKGFDLLKLLVNCNQNLSLPVYAAHGQQPTFHHITHPLNTHNVLPK